MGPVSWDTVVLAGTLVGGFLIHLFYFGKGLGRLESSVNHLSMSFDDFKAQHFIPREEFEARHKELIALVARKNE